MKGPREMSRSGLIWAISIPFAIVLYLAMLLNVTLARRGRASPRRASSVSEDPELATV
ncbi:MAG: hypothetical protein GWN99_13770 [Gemmatimonadetes bacterium]|uniref:Uncharacterized protein n=1 Tax=Candidatus Kutchimonas denitrificans TaxID=3056748 RepID=A0AAE4ZB23_9BACT|nr:hypothetical protein [Gemmatimonadota bacterium]NIR75957.1 hypothetical protein [Candidatus Kutchimonas denitrificans]NIS02114.1 hypothetical protein [Gemmatimonadota bacterium]NIT67939.1 hypothetical protein [Gemmatimonadota bacterium]NIU53933.1 hypothetical protein [Gemmatimonadota bacterium]